MQSYGIIVYMSLLLIIFAVLFIIGLGVYLARDESCSDCISDFGEVCNHKPNKMEKKKEGIDKVLKFLQEKDGGQVTNNDVEKLLGVSDATATRYLSELERNGKITQIGTTGKGVYYTLKNTM